MHDELGGRGWGGWRTGRLWNWWGSQRVVHRSPDWGRLWASASAAVPVARPNRKEGRQRPCGVVSLPPKSERARGPKDKFRVQNTYLLFGPGELATTSSYRDNARDSVIFENYRYLPCGVIDSQSMTRECHADCNITLLLNPKSAESTKEDGVVRSSDKSRIGRGTGLVCHCGSSASWQGWLWQKSLVWAN